MKNISLFYVFFIISALLVSCEKEINSDKFPKVNTTRAQISGNKLYVSGDLVDAGGGAVTERGICYAHDGSSGYTSNHMNLRYGEHVSDNSTYGVSFQCGIDLSNFTVYNRNVKVRAYAVNKYGTSYGDIIYVDLTSYYCPSTVKDYDGNEYHTVLIGNKCWMRENLRTTRLKNGNSIDLKTSSSSGSISVPERYYPNGYSGNVNSYGYLYNYAAVANDPCPQGWHIPSYNEVPDAGGGALKVTGTTYWNYPNTGASNSSGFTGYGGGYRGRSGSYEEWKEHGLWWTKSEYNSSYAYDFCLSYDDSYLHRWGYSNYDYAMDKEAGLSIRCVKDSYGLKDAKESCLEHQLDDFPGIEAGDHR